MNLFDRIMRKFPNALRPARDDGDGRPDTVARTTSRFEDFRRAFDDVDPSDMTVSKARELYVDDVDLKLDPTTMHERLEAYVFRRIVNECEPTFDNPATQNPRQAAGIKTKAIDRRVLEDAVHTLRRRGFGESPPGAASDDDVAGAGWFMHPHTRRDMAANSDHYQVPDDVDDYPVRTAFGFDVNTSKGFPEDTVLLVDYDAVTVEGRVIQPAGVVVIGITGDKGEA